MRTVGAPMCASRARSAPCKVARFILAVHAQPRHVPEDSPTPLHPTRNIKQPSTQPTKQQGKNRANAFRRFLNGLGHFYRKYHKTIGLKAGELRWSILVFSNSSILIFERPKPNLFTISGFWDPWEPLFMDLNIPNYFAKI